MRVPEVLDFVLKEENKLLGILRHVDLVLEVLDARLPFTSRNVRLRKILTQKNVIILNKADLAEKEITDRWLNFYYRERCPVFPFSTKQPAALKELEKKLWQQRPRNLRFNRPLRLIVAGIPNVGKSSIINRLAGKFALKTGARPGITRGLQWIRLRAGWEMLDTPGLLSPYLRNKNSRLALAAIGALEKGFAVEDAACWLLSRISGRPALFRRFLDFYLETAGTSVRGETLLQEIGRARGCLGTGGLVDRQKVANLLLNDFRRGAWGRISLERPEDVTAVEREG